MSKIGFTDSSGRDLSEKYVTRDYAAQAYPDISASLKTTTLWTWGYNQYGQTGQNSAATSISVPGLAGPANNLDVWKVAANMTDNYVHMAFITAAGTVYTCGSGYLGSLGDGAAYTSGAGKSLPVLVVGGGTYKEITAGANHTAAIRTDGSLWAWGYNLSGQLGDSSNINKSSPVTTAGGGTTWNRVSAGSLHTTAVKTDGTLWTWGSNLYGQLGTGNTTSRSSPGTTVGGGTNWIQVSGGFSHTAAIKSDGTLWTWGSNSSGELGDGTTNSRNSPATTAGGGNNWKYVSAGGYNTAAIKTDGTLWTWGLNTYGQLADGTSASRSSPGTVAGGGTTWSQVSAAVLYNAAAIKTDGTLWTWGLNTWGVLGDGTTITPFSPVLISKRDTTWKYISVGANLNCALLGNIGW